MALSKNVYIDKIEVDSYGDLYIRTVTEIIEDTKILTQAYHRRVIYAEDNVSTEDTKIQQIHSAALLNKRLRPVSILK